MFKRQEPNKDILDGLKYLSATHRKLHEIRQKYEWRIVFAILTFYILAMTALLGVNQIGVSDNVLIQRILDYKNIIFFCIVIISLTSIILLGYIHGANAKNKKIAENAEKKIAEWLNGKHGFHKGIGLIYPFPEEGNEKSFTENIKDWWALIWQSTIIIIFALLLAFIISILGKPMKNNPDLENTEQCVCYTNNR